MPEKYSYETFFVKNLETIRTTYQYDLSNLFASKKKSQEIIERLLQDFDNTTQSLYQWIVWYHQLFRSLPKDSPLLTEQWKKTQENPEEFVQKKLAELIETMQNHTQEVINMREDLS